MWVEIQIEVAADAAELLAAAVTPLTGGVELRDAGTLLGTAPDRSAVVALCAPAEVGAVLAAVDECLSLARAGGTAVDPVVVRQRSAHEDEWRDVWKAFFRTTRIGRHFIVRPSWEKVEIAGDDHVIDLDPGRAFGTGAHPSTRLVIALIERVHAERPRLERFLDLGCGSGILAIAASRLWPEAEGLAVDNDPEATACTRENLERNRVTRVAVTTGTLEGCVARPDLVMANIQADVLKALGPELARRLAPGGRLVLSGLLTSDAHGLEERYARLGLPLLARQDEDEWAGLLLGM